MRLQQALDEEWEVFRIQLGWQPGPGGLGTRTMSGIDPSATSRSSGTSSNSETPLTPVTLSWQTSSDGAPTTARRSGCMLAALRPGLVRLSRRASAFWDPEEAESAVVAAALDRLASRTIKFPNHPAAGVLGSVWRSVWQRRLRERWEEDYWGRRADAEALDQVVAQRHDTPTHRVLEVIEESVRSRRGASARRSPARPELGARLLQQRDRRARWPAPLHHPQAPTRR